MIRQVCVMLISLLFVDMEMVRWGYLYYVCLCLFKFVMNQNKIDRRLCKM